MWKEREVCGVGEEGGMCDKRKVCGWIGRCVEGEGGIWEEGSVWEERVVCGRLWEEG